MALNPALLQCAVCLEGLDMELNTLPCLHSFCLTCFDQHFEGQVNGRCPECEQLVSPEQLSLSPFLVKSIRLRQLELTEWKCDWCSGGGYESIARNWCHNCKELLCGHCCRIHERWEDGHHVEDLALMDWDSVTDAIIRDIMAPCLWHWKAKNSYCERCNLFFCVECYKYHLGDSPQCSSEELSHKNLVFDRQWDLQGSNVYVSSICVSKDDDHVFVCDENNKSIIEYSEWGELMAECVLTDGKEEFVPKDMCLIPSQVLAVACGRDNKLIFLERRTVFPFLQIKNIVHTQERYYSLCLMNNKILACNLSLEVDSFTKEGQGVKTFKTRGLRRGLFCPRIRADPTTGNFWATRLHSPVMYCYGSNGERLRKADAGGRGITDICVNESGHLYYCNSYRIVSHFLRKDMCIFDRVSQFYTKIFISKNKVYVSVKIEGKYLIQIFNILD